MAIRRTVALGIAALATALPLGFLYPRSAAAATPAAVPARTTLYSASSKASFAKWKVDPGFKVSGGVLSYDGKGANGDAGAVAPFTTKGLTSFAVEVRMQIGKATNAAQASYDLFVRRSAKNGRTGIFAGYDAVAGTDSARNVADLFWNGTVDNYVPGAAFTPGSAFHTYRIEVQGTVYRFLIDGKAVVPWTIIKDDSTFTRLGLAFVYVPAKIKSFKVLTLPSAAITTQLDTSLLESRAFLAADVGVAPFVGVFEDDSAYATDYNLSAADLQSMDRLYGYREEFQNNSTLITDMINVHSSPAGAKAAFDFFVTRFKAAQTQVTDFGENDVSTLGIGDNAFSFHYQYTFQGAASYVDEVVFQSGNYFESVVVDSSSQSESQTAATLAQMANKLIQTPHA
jgi:hypothetical protein